MRRPALSNHGRARGRTAPRSRPCAEHNAVSRRPGRSSRNFAEIGTPEAIHRQSSREAVIKLRSEEHTSELQSLMRISYAVFCLKKKTDNVHITLMTSSG